MKKLILLLLIIINLSCSKDSSEVGDGLPYFQFIQADSNKFINSTEVGKILIYKNQNNAELQFKVMQNRIEKKLESRGTFVVGSYKYFYFDEQRIQFGGVNDDTNQYYEEYYSFYISLKRYPKIFQTNPTVISSDSQIISNIGVRHFDNSEAPPIFFTEPIISLTINSTVYNKVRKIAIPTNPYPNLNSSLKGLTFVYYDQNKGIVGFDDVENNMWRLQN
jgi:hypothetical protein